MTRDDVLQIALDVRTRDHVMLPIGTVCELVLRLHDLNPAWLLVRIQAADKIKGSVMLTQAEAFGLVRDALRMSEEQLIDVLWEE